ncbi:hypothetical protein ACFSYD_17855 [Paracoccus aerius]
MTNAGFTGITQYRDIELINMHREMLDQGLPERQFLEGAGITARDNARTPMQWDASPARASPRAIPGSRSTPTTTGSTWRRSGTTRNPFWPITATSSRCESGTK